MQRFQFALVLLIGCSLGLSAGEDPWTDIDSQQLGNPAMAPIQPRMFRGLILDFDSLESLLAQAPNEGEPAGIQVDLPRPDGIKERFDVWNSPIMALELAIRHPEIRTFLVRSTNGARGRIDITPQGFHAMISDADGTWLIDPYIPLQTNSAISYFKADLLPTPGRETECLFDQFTNGERQLPISENRVPIAGELLNYRLAVSTTGEYAQFHGGTIPLVLAAIVTAINRVNEVYETEVAIRMNLIANNEDIIFLDAGTDPFTNDNPGDLIDQNQTVIDSVIGSANYDIGHNFSTGGGGLANLRVVCVNGDKARGITGLPNPTGDPFYIDFVSHEMGHQWGGNHTFNGSTGNCSGGNRNGSTAYEPGSGSTIQAYAGICISQNLQNNSDPYFHGISYDQIVDHSRVGAGSSCGVSMPVSNTAPIVDAGDDYTIPRSTPFELTGVATDMEGTPLTYCWEEFDLGPAGAIGTDNGNSPIFRSWNPTLDPVRTFPRLSDLINNTVPFGEVLAVTNRSLNFRLTVRDNHSGGGGVDFDTNVLTVTTSAGPFVLTSPNTAVSWMILETETVTWDVANTDQAPVSAALVDILLSTDGGLTYPVTLASGTPNDGSEAIVVPNLATSNARVKVIASDNIFFDMSDTNFTVTELLLACPNQYHFWGMATAGVFLDSNGNGVVDVSDLIDCIL